MSLQMSRKPLRDYLSPSAYRQLKLEKLRWKARRNSVPAHWLDFLAKLFPHLFYYPLALHHLDFWGHIDGIQPQIKPSAFFAILPRGGGKSSNVEAATAFLGVQNRRKFCLYVRSTQAKANESVQNIASMLEKLTERKVGKYGNSKGWRIDTLRCANGFNVVALGFDAAVRGIRIEEYRPDLILLDDIDDKDDTLITVEKKIKTLTDDILPAGSRDVAVIGVQNLIHYNSIFKRVADGKADFLHNRIVSGPFPAVIDLEYEARPEGGYRITGGTPTWEGQNLEVCEAQINEWGPDAFLKESQQIVTLAKGRVFHGYTGPGPDAKTLDYSRAQGYWHAHDFGGTNEVWGLFVKIDDIYYLIYEQMLPEATTARRAEMVKGVIGAYLKADIERHEREIAASGNAWNLINRAFEAAWLERVIAGYGGAKGEKQIRADYRGAGLDIQPPNVSAVESQVNTTNEMLKGERGNKVVICSNCVHTIDNLEHCIRDPLGAILNERSFHYTSMLRYFCSGVGSGLHWAK